MQQTSSARRQTGPARQTGGLSWPRLIVVLVLGWWTFRLGTGLARWCPVDWVNLPFHEAGHIFLRPFGETAHYLGGTIFQLLIPAVLIWYFLVRRPNRFGSACCAWWLGESLINVSIYMADARDLTLPLVGGGHHDWNHLFYAFGLLDERSVSIISGATHLLGVLVMLFGLAWSLFFVLPEARRALIREVVADRIPVLAMLLE
jgi:hypothetical protein